MNLMAEPLYQIAKNMHDLTKCQISISDFNNSTFLCYPLRSTLFCWTLRETENLRERCRKCDKNACKICSEKRDVYSYNCHIGLTEIICPIFEGGNPANNIIGYIAVGQIVQTDKEEKCIQKILESCKEINLDPTELLEHLKTLPHLEEKQIKALTNYTAIMAEYIATHNLLPKEFLNTAYKIRKYIADNISSELNIPHLCKTFNISKTTINNTLNEAFNMSATKIIAYERITTAKRLIKQGSLSMNAISERVGVFDPNYFSKLFKSVTGMTPSEYKKSLK